MPGRGIAEVRVVSGVPREVTAVPHVGIAVPRAVAAVPHAGSAVPGEVAAMARVGIAVPGEVAAMARAGIAVPRVVSALPTAVLVAPHADDALARRSHAMPVSVAPPRESGRGAADAVNRARRAPAARPPAAARRGDLEGGPHALVRALSRRPREGADPASAL